MHDVASVGLRAQDSVEMAALGWASHEEVLLRSTAASVALMTGTVDGEAHGIFGVGPVPDTDFGAPWYLGTERSLYAARQLMEWGPDVIAAMHEHYDILVNHVHVDNSVSIEWLRRMGFTFNPPYEVPSGALFIPFYRRTEDPYNV